MFLLMVWWKIKRNMFSTGRWLNLIFFFKICLEYSFREKFYCRDNNTCSLCTYYERRFVGISRKQLEVNSVIYIQPFFPSYYCFRFNCRTSILVFDLAATELYLMEPVILDVSQRMKSAVKIWNVITKKKKQRVISVHVCTVLNLNFLHR